MKELFGKLRTVFGVLLLGIVVSPLSAYAYEGDAPVLDSIRRPTVGLMWITAAAIHGQT